MPLAGINAWKAQISQKKLKIPFLWNEPIKTAFGIPWRKTTTYWCDLFCLLFISTNVELIFWKEWTKNCCCCHPMIERQHNNMGYFCRMPNKAMEYKLKYLEQFQWECYKSNINIKYSLRIGNGSRLRQRHGLQNTTLTSYFSKKIYRKVIYANFYESIFQDQSIHIIFTFVNSTT